MSHWTTAKVILKDLEILKQVAKSKGINVRTADGNSYLDFHSEYAGELEAKLILSKDGGHAGICNRSNQDEYKLVMDNYNNPLAEQFGNDCAELTRDYAAAVVRQQTLNAGHSVMSQEVQEDGRMIMHVAIN